MPVRTSFGYPAGAEGTRMLIGGVYTLRYEHRNGDWLIVHHHISGMYRRLSSTGELAERPPCPTRRCEAIGALLLDRWLPQ